MTSPTLSPPTAGVRLSGLVKSYGDVRAVQGVDIAVARGETLALLGPNGAGKSTTIDMMLGLTRPDRGHVDVFGMSPAEAARRGEVGVMLQTGGLIRDLSVRELITMMASLFPEALGVDEVLTITGLHDVADRRTQKLSGGQVQRTRFALAMVPNPELLVLDEPTVALDVEARHAFWTSMRDFAARGRTVIFATHHLEEADAYADRVVLMSLGRVVADGPPTEIKARVGRRVLRATLVDADADALAALPGVARVDRRGDGIELQCIDSDAAVRALLVAFPAARDIEIRGAGLEEAFLELTVNGDRAPVLAEVDR
jgi:ABC-2 type transport system ATP-binding protein